MEADERAAERAAVAVAGDARARVWPSVVSYASLLMRVLSGVTLSSALGLLAYWYRVWRPARMRRRQHASAAASPALTVAGGGATTASDGEAGVRSVRTSISALNVAGNEFAAGGPASWSDDEYGSGADGDSDDRAARTRRRQLGVADGVDGRALPSAGGILRGLGAALFGSAGGSGGGGDDDGAGDPGPGSLALNLGAFARRSRLVAMRMRKHFTLQTNLLLRENEPTFAGAFAVGHELRSVRRGPLSFIPFIGTLLTREEFLLVKSAILVFITVRREPRARRADPVS